MQVVARTYINYYINYIYKINNFIIYVKIYSDGVVRLRKKSGGTSRLRCIPRGTIRRVLLAEKLWVDQYAKYDLVIREKTYY